jgi:hypothetical protein
LPNFLWYDTTRHRTHRTDTTKTVR